MDAVAMIVQPSMPAAEMAVPLDGRMSGNSGMPGQFDSMLADVQQGETSRAVTDQELSAVLESDEGLQTGLDPLLYQMMASLFTQGSSLQLPESQASGVQDQTQSLQIIETAVPLDGHDVVDNPEPLLNLEPQLQAKVETQPQVKVETQPQVNVETQPQVKVETQPQVKVETQPQVKVETQPQAKVETQPQAKVETQPQVKVETQPQVKVETQPQAKVETQPQAKVETQPQAKVETQPQAKVETQLQAKVETQLQAKVETQLQAKVETQLQAKVEVEPQAAQEPAGLVRQESGTKPVLTYGAGLVQSRMQLQTANQEMSQPAVVSGQAMQDAGETASPLIPQAVMATADTDADFAGGTGDGESTFHGHLQHTGGNTGAVRSAQVAESGADENHPPVAGQVAEKMLERLGTPEAKLEGEQRLTLRLTPEHLGEIQLSFQLDKQGVRVEVFAEQRATKDLLQQQADELRESLARQNIRLDSFEVATGNGNGLSQQSQNWRQMTAEQQLRQADQARSNPHALSDTSRGALSYIAPQYQSTLDVRF